MNHGLSEKTVNQISSVFERFPEVEKAVLYGSRAKGNFKTGSDIDLTLYGEKLSARLLGDIAEALDDLLLPYTIDLSIFNDLNHAKLREHIERVGVVFYEKKNQNMKAGWEIKTFENVLEIKNGRNQKAVQKENGQYPIYGSTGNVMGWTDNYICEAGTTIIGRKGTINNPIYTETKFWNVDTTFGLSPKEFLDAKFLHYFCISYDFSEHNRGTTIPSLVKTDLLQIQIPIPPLPEQKRLVTLIDEAFESIATAKANAQQNLKNARALFESHLNEVFSKRDEGWEVKTLKELTTILGDGLHGTPNYTDDGDYYFINGNNLTDGVIEFKDNTKRVSVDEFNKHKKNLTDRTILVSINGTLGNVAFYNGEKVILGKSACYFFNLKNDVDKNFVKCIFSSLYFLEYAHKEATGATIKNVSLKSMGEFKIPLPSLPEQQKISAKIKDISEETQHLEALYSRKIAALDELKKALLHRAFSGEL